jgi:hypothetical protein
MLDSSTNFASLTSANSIGLPVSASQFLIGPFKLFGGSAAPKEALTNMDRKLLQHLSVDEARVVVTTWMLLLKEFN